MVVNNRHKTNILSTFSTNENDINDENLQILNLNDDQSNTIKHSWQYTVQLNPITFYDENIGVQLYKKVLGILNKLTWVNFNELLIKFQELPIENKECLENIATIVAFKAFDEHSFGSLYAALCKALNIRITLQNNNGAFEITFKRCVINVCQNYFQNECMDYINTNDTSIEHEQVKKRQKLRTIGCLRFIGELFRKSLLPPSVVHYCISMLQKKKDEKHLEYICNLLRVAGKELNEKINLRDIFNYLEYLTSEDMRSKISPRIRFFIKDVLEMQLNSVQSQKSN
ncbi:uncharacterized protein LOC126901122 isoform X2 [Daktulosphaira vitifoliae]|uniref:uncharacterized protein LOC126901122 isoform X2 n=1 Tax=Daktulosphaira vitifoliae TaxID=58002 RepID=UPI0021A9AB90|nr:uncharacterized protein LOC126901122 isoform X2 [Daktulosphaira vitifoliae]